MMPMVIFQRMSHLLMPQSIRPYQWKRTLVDVCLLLNHAILIGAVSTNGEIPSSLGTLVHGGTPYNVGVIDQLKVISLMVLPSCKELIDQLAPAIAERTFWPGV